MRSESFNMLSKMNSLPYATRVSWVVTAFLAVLASVGLASVALLSLSRPTWSVTLWTMSTVVVASIALLIVARRGNERTAAYIAIAVVSIAVAIDSLNPNRTFGLAGPGLPLLIVFAAFTFGMRAMAATVALNAVLVIAVTTYKLTALSMADRMSAMQRIDAIAYLIYFAATACVMVLLNRWVEAAQRQIDAANVRTTDHLRSLEREIDARKSLELEQQSRANELSKLLDISTSLSSTIELPVLLDLILAKLSGVVYFDEAFIAEFVGGQSLDVQIASTAGLHPVSLKGAIWRYAAETDSVIAELVSRRAPVVVTDLAGASDAATISFKAWHVRNNGQPKRPMAAAMLVPLVVKGRTTGLMCLCTSREGYYSERLAKLASAFGSQAAAAIETVRLHGEALRAAALNERTRLARDLHDSVSQSLYGIVLGARTAKATLLNAGSTDQTLDYVLRLAESGLTEMRALIFELRPEHLDQEGLLSALDKQVNAICSRHHIRPTLTLPITEPSLPARVKESIYRIVIEATHNAIKHASCSELRLDIVTTGAELLVTILDNGVGFDTGASFPNNWGLTGMRERAHEINGVLTIESARSMGTIVTLKIPLSWHAPPTESQLELFGRPAPTSAPANQQVAEMTPDGRRDSV
jgi:signal transduction histidine kinase